MKERASAEGVHFWKFEAFGFQVNFRKANHFQVLHKFMICGHFRVLLEIGIWSNNFIYLLVILLYKFSCIEAKYDKERAKRFLLLLLMIFQFFLFCQYASAVLGLYRIDWSWYWGCRSWIRLLHNRIGCCVTNPAELSNRCTTFKDVLLTGFEHVSVHAIFLCGIFNFNVFVLGQRCLIVLSGLQWQHLFHLLVYLVCVICQMIVVGRVLYTLWNNVIIIFRHCRVHLADGVQAKTSSEWVKLTHLIPRHVQVYRGGYPSKDFPLIRMRRAWWNNIGRVYCDIWGPLLMRHLHGTPFFWWECRHHNCLFVCFNLFLHIKLLCLLYWLMLLNNLIIKLGRRDTIGLVLGSRRSGIRVSGRDFRSRLDILSVLQNYFPVWILFFQHYNIILNNYLWII